MKSERVTLLTSPEFKAFLVAEAKREGVSVAELVRTRCERRASPQEALLVALTFELRKAVLEAQQSLREGLAQAWSVLQELRAGRARRRPSAARADPYRLEGRD